MVPTSVLFSVVSKHFCGSKADMVRGNCGRLFFCSCDQGASGQVVCLSEDAAGALVDGCEGCRIKGVFLHPCDGQMMPFDSHGTPDHLTWKLTDNVKFLSHI